MTHRDAITGIPVKPQQSLLHAAKGRSKPTKQPRITQEEIGIIIGLAVCFLLPPPTQLVGHETGFGPSLTEPLSLTRVTDYQPPETTE